MDIASLEAGKQGDKRVGEQYMESGESSGARLAPIAPSVLSARMFSRRCLPLVFALLLAPLPAAADAPMPLYQWTQFAPGGLEARAIVEQAQRCPDLWIDGKPLAMKVRASPGPNYPVTVCALAIPAGAKSASIAGRALPLPKARADRVLLIGDTGCRLSKEAVQNCNDDDAWPFPKGSAVEAGLAPDVVIHLGDFHYREAPCPIGEKGCAGSPFGDSWAVWKADFFEPARPLLERAPFLFARGNHEECERGGKGWSRTLDPYPFVSDSGCLGLGAPFVADIGGQNVVALDVSTAAELRASAAQAAFFRKEFQDVARLAPDGPVWLAFHRPIWAVGINVFGFIIGDNKTLELAARDAIPANVDLLLSGHIHTFQILGYREDLPIQIVSGHGGDELHRSAPGNPVGTVIGGVTVAAGHGTPGIFGFAMLEREDGGWRVTDYDIAARALLVCHTRARKLSCDPNP